MYREEINRAMREAFENIMNKKLTGKELAREKEIKEIARKEKEEYEKKKADFYNNPLHWDNNKRRRYHLPALRGEVNKYRSKQYPAFHPTARLFYIIEDVIEEKLTNKLSNNDFFGQFVDIKDVTLGDTNVFYVAE